MEAWGATPPGGGEGNGFRFNFALGGRTQQVRARRPAARQADFTQQVGLRRG